MKSRFIKYIERYLRFKPYEATNLRCDKLYLIGRIFSNLPLQFVQQFTVNTAIPADLVEDWGKTAYGISKLLSRDAHGEIHIPSTQQSTFNKLVNAVIALGCEQILNEAGELHPRLIYLLNLESLVDQHGKENLTPHVLWSFCHDIVSCALRLYFENEELNIFSGQLKKEYIANLGMNFAIAFSKQCDSYACMLAIQKFVREKKYEKTVLFLEEHFIGFLTQLAEALRTHLKDIIYNDINNIECIPAQHPLAANLKNRRKLFWINVSELLPNFERKLKNMILVGLNKDLHIKPKKSEDIIYVPQLKKWFNARDNYFVLKELIYYASFKNKNFKMSTVDKLKKLFGKQELLELSTTELLKALAEQDKAFLTLLENFMPTLQLVPRYTFFNDLFKAINKITHAEAAIKPNIKL